MIAGMIIIGMSVVWGIATGFTLWVMIDWYPRMKARWFRYKANKALGWDVTFWREVPKE